jgi:hypothetical protein
MLREDFLTIPEGIALGRQNIVFNIHPERYEKINDDRRPHRKKRDVDKIFSDGRGGHSHFFAQVGADAKHMPFYELPEALHGC